MVRQRELLKHISAREPVVWLALKKGQIEIGSFVPMSGGETGCTLGLWSSIKLLFDAHPTKHSLLNVLVLYPHYKCWQLKSPACTHGDGNTGRDIINRCEDGGL